MRAGRAHTLCFPEPPMPRLSTPPRNMASHGRRGPSSLLLGSETIKVLTHYKAPVLAAH